ncbi:MAG: hypothetical protein ABI577_16075 [bacterium]
MALESVSDWLADLASIPIESYPPVDEEFVDRLLAAGSTSDWATQLADEQLDRAIWNLAFSIDEMLAFSSVPVEKQLAVLELLPHMFDRLVIVGADRVTAGSYFWESAVSSAASKPAPIGPAVIAALDRQANSGGPEAFWAIMQALECMHGAPGAPELAARMLQYPDLDDSQRQFAQKVLDELTVFERRVTQ